MSNFSNSPRCGSVVAALCLAAAPATAQCDPLLDLVPGSTSSFPDHLTSVRGNLLLFSARTPATGDELWSYRAGAGASLLLDLNSASRSGPQEFTEVCTPFGPMVFFYAVGNDGAELFRTDGTVAGTQQVGDIRPNGVGGLIGGHQMRAAGSKLFFVADDGVHGAELWTSDGSAAGSRMLVDIRSGRAASNPDMLVAVGDKVFFTAFDGANGRELWVSDGTAGGTLMVRDINPGTGSSFITQAGEFEGRMFFGANDGASGAELWVTDGTGSGTAQLLDIYSGGRGSDPAEFLATGDSLFFAATTFFQGRELWKTDGTQGGTAIVKDIERGVRGSAPTQLIESNGLLFFSATESSVGTELFVSDGTDPGTRSIELEPGLGSGSPSQFVAVGRGVCFRGFTSSGAELWFSDGSVPGTRLLCDIEPGPGSGNVNQLAVVGSELMFVAQTAATGTELGRLPVPGATVTELPGASAPSYPALSVREKANPVLGTAIDIEASGPAGSIGNLFASFPQPPLPALAFMDGGCDLVGLQNGQAFAVASLAGPAWTLPLAIPANSALAGAGLNLQVFWFDAGASPPIETSHGLQLFLGAGEP